MRLSLNDERAWRVARAALGALFLVRTTALANLLPIPLAHVHGAILGFPPVGFRFAWLDVVLPSELLLFLVIARTVAGLAFTVGLAPRASGLCAATCAFLALSQDPFGAYYTLLVLFGGVAILALAAPERGAAGPAAWLVRAFVASIYFWSAVAKLHASWLDGAVLRALAEDGHLHAPMASWLLANRGLCHAAAWLVPATELGLAAAILAPRTRRAALFTAIAFHLLLEATARPDVIGWAMIALLVGCAGSKEAPRA